MYQKFTAILLMLLSMSIASCQPLSKITPYRTQPVEFKKKEVKAIESANLINKGEKMVVAVMVPLSGKNAKLGTSLLDSVTLAMHDYNFQDLEIVPIDTENEDNFQTLKDKKINIIFGPLFAKDVEKVASEMKNSNIPILTFSNDPNLTGIPGVFILGMDPTKQIDYVINYAASHGYNNLFSVTSQDEYGQIAKKAAIENKKAKYIKGYEYSHQQETAATFSNTIEEIRGHLNSSDKYAILFPEGGAPLIDFARSMKLALNDQYQIKLIGSAQWQGMEKSMVPDLKGSWYVSANQEKITEFTEKFVSMFGYNPAVIAALAYDATLIAHDIHGTMQLNGKNTLTYKDLYNREFQAITGPLSFGKNGKCVRQFSVRKI